MRFRRIIEELDKDLQEIDQQFELEEKKSKKVKDQGHRSVEFKADNNPEVSKMDFLPASVLKKIAKEKSQDENVNLDEEEVSLNEKKKRPGNPNYYKGTRKSNSQMAREINKCTQPDPPKSCYDEWTADKSYKKSKKYNESFEDIEEMINELKEIQLDEGISAKVKKTLSKKAKNANMPLGALTSVYRKGLAAWLTGHRQGIPQHAWAMARVNSFIRGGKTRSVDKSEWKKVQKHRSKNESVSLDSLEESKKKNLK